MSSAPPIRGVLFDLDGTLYDLAALRRRLLFRLPRELLRHGLIGSWRRLRGLQRFRRLREAHRGSPPVPSLREHLVEKAAEALGYPRERVQGAVADFFYESDFPELRGLSPPEDHGVLDQLAQRGYRLGVVSEYPVERKLRALGLGTLPWQALVDCEQVGTLKPQPEVFLRGARELGLDPREILLVGDRRDIDVAGAVAVGMRSAWMRLRDPGHGSGPAPDWVLLTLADLLPRLPPLLRSEP